MAKPLKVKCPKCGRGLVQSGEIEVTPARGAAYTVATFQCDECIVNTVFLGEKMELPLTFAVGPDGKAFDPADPERDLSK